MKNIDYAATLKIFFAENIKYLEKLRIKTKDKKAVARIAAAIDMVKRIMAEPHKFADYRVRVKEGMENGELAEAFIPEGSQNNSVTLSFFAVLNAMGDLKSPHEYEREQAEAKLLNALKGIKYKNSSSLLKDFTFPFKSPAYFAVQAQKKQYQI